MLLGAAGVLLGLAFYGFQSERGLQGKSGTDPETARNASGTGQASVERIVLVTIDTLRVDHLSSYGYRINTTPFLDSLAKRGV